MVRFFHWIMICIKYVKTLKHTFKKYCCSFFSNRRRSVMLPSILKRKCRLPLRRQVSINHTNFPMVRSSPLATSASGVPRHCSSPHSLVGVWITHYGPLTKQINIEFKLFLNTFDGCLSIRLFEINNSKLITIGNGRFMCPKTLFKPAFLGISKLNIN